MTAKAAAADYSTATWLGNSQIIMNSNSGWYSAGGSGNTAFHGANLGTFSTETSLTMGGQIQTYGDNDADGHVVEMNYSVYPSSSSASTWHSQELAWYDYANNNNWFGTSDGSSRPAVIDISTLAAGTYKLEVYFRQQTGASSWLYETYDVHNYVANFTIGATLTRTPTSLSGFSTESGTASAAQSFSVTATHLNGNLTVTAPTGYEVSTSSGSGYAGSVTLSRDANNKVTGQTVYVRLKSDAAVGSRTGNVTVSGGGTTQVTVGLTGGVTPKPPTKGTVSYPSNEAEGRVVIPWTKNTAGNDVMVVRVANNGTAPSPANGTSYSQGGTLGSGQIVYKGNATSYKDTGLTAGTDYDYYLFSVSGNYYSTGVKVDATASKAPRFATSSVSKSTTVGGTASNTQTASGTPSSMTYSVTCTSGGATSGFSVNNSGVFSFAPTAAGTYVFTVSAANGVTAVSASSYTVTVTATAAAPTVGSPSRTGTTAVGATLGGTVSSTGGATVTEWGVVYSATSLNTDPTVGGTGCTNVTASGTPGASAFTAAVTGLKANTEYKWKAYAVNSVGTGYTAVQTFTTPCMSAGPVVTPTPGNGTATFTWADVGAVQYLLSLWTGGSAASRTETFNSSSLSGSSYTGNTSITGGDLGTWSSSGARGDQTTIDGKAPIIRYGNTLTSPALTIAFTQVTFEYAWPYSETGSWNMDLYINSTKVGSYTVTGGTAGTATYTGLSGAVGDTITIKNASTATSNKRILIDNIVISGSGGTYVSGYGADGGEVTSPVTVSGLTSGTTYNWSLKAVGGGTGCEEDGTPATGYDYTVTPTMADVAPVWATTVGPWTATVGTELSKTLTESLSTLGSPAPTFSRAVQGTAPAGTHGVTSAGVFTFTPAEGDAGKSFVFRFTASNTQGSPTKDVVVNVAALAPTITEGTKTLGTTSATLPVTVNMRGGATTADITLEYGTTTSYGSSASVSPTRITTGLNAGTAVTGTIASGLEPGTTYSYRWTVKNSAGTTTKTGTFTTLDVVPAVASAGSLNVTVNTGATATLAATGAGAWVTAGTHLTYALSTTVSSSLYTWTAGTGTLAFRPTATGTYTFNLTASNGRGSATYAWTVTVANAPTITKGEASTSGTTATVPATIHAGGAATTVTFKYGTAEGTYNLNPASLSGGSVAAGATAAAASASLSGLTQGTTYYYQWTAVNAGGTTVETGSFFQPGDGLEFPGQMNGWAQSGTTTRDAEFGGGNYYYTPATRLTGDQMFKAYKGGTWYGNGAWVTGNNSGHVFTVNENTAENKLCVTETGGAFPPSGVGYYTLRGHDTGSGIEYVALYTENAPVTFTGASDNHAARGTADVTVTATLSGAKSASEKVYLRYTTDGWSTSSLVQMSGSGTSYTGTIPGQGKGTTVEWYVLTSPHDAVADHVDLCTLRGLKNGTDNFTYTTALLPPRNCTATAGYEKVTLGWDLNEAGNAVMVIRYAGTSPSVTAPVDGTAYAADTSALGGTVVYGAYAHPSGSESLENVVSQGTGYTYVLYSVEGSGGSSKYSAGVTVTATTASLATPTVGVTTAGAGTLTGAAAGKGEIYVVARIAGSGSFSGTPSGAAPNAGQSLCGGTVVYKGTAGSFSVADMEGCQTYKYKAWLHAADENAWSAGSSVATVTMPTPAAPTLNALADITYQGFTASWNAVPGAVTYRMDIVKGGGAGGWTKVTGSPEVIEEGEYIIADGNSDDGTVGIMGAYSGSAYYGADTVSISSGQISAETVVADANIWIFEQVVEVEDGVTYVYYRIKNKATGYYVDCGTAKTSMVAVDPNSEDAPDAQWEATIVDGLVTLRNPWENYQTAPYILYNTSANPKRFSNYAASTSTMHHLSLYKRQSAATPVAGWTDRDVGSLMTVSGGVVSVPVTGLDELTTYNVTVRAEGSTAACASGDSNTQSATTLENDTVTTVTISDADGAGGASAVAAGTVAAGQTVLVQGSKLVVASGSVNPTLTGVTFTTTGTAGTGDLATYRVKVTQSATWAAGDTGLKGTVTAGAAGSHTVTFGSAQTLTAGQTYYVWIEAVTKAEATGGNTVGVAALTKDAFAMTGARKNGSTAATGAQKIGNLSSLSVAALTGVANQGAALNVTFGRSLADAESGVLIRWSDVGYSEIPAPGTAWTKETTVAVGTASPVEVSGLTACKTYYFKAWEVVGSAVAGTAQQASGAVAEPAAPTGLGHGTPGAHNATLTWSASAGATGYVIDLWHYEGGSGGGGETATYTLASKTSVTVTGTRPTGATEEFTSTYSGTVGQMTSGNSQTLTLHGYSGVRITGITLSMKSNSSDGAGGMTIQVGSAAPVVVVPAETEFCHADWNGAWSTSFVDVEKAVNVNVSAGEDVVIQIVASENSLYCQSYSVTYSAGTRVDDVIGGVVQSGSAVTVTASGATGVNVGGLTDGTTYGWDVKAQGVECTGAASASDTFKTAELLGAPVINTPLTVGVEQLSGTITGAAGAQMILKRYESEDAAMAATADGSLGGVVVTATEGTGAAAGTWTFEDTGLDGCKTYYYRAWQKATVDGEQATSAGSNVASGKTDLGTPTVNAVGAGTQMTISWNAVPGAVSYKVMLTDTEGVWTTTGGGSGTTQLSMDFAGITANNTELNTAANLTANGLTGWGATKVWTVVEEGEGATTLKYVKLGSGSAGGSLTTPQISAMSAGGKATFDLKTFTGGNGKSDSSTVTVAIKYTGDADFEPLKTFTPSADWQNYQVSITGTKAFQLQLSSSAGNNRFHIDNLVVTENGSGGGSSGKVGLKYEATVTSAPFERTVDDLTMGETYWYKVIATGAESCETASAVGSGTPANAPLIEVTPMHYNFGTVNKNEGGATATFTVRNTGSIALKFTAVTVEPDGGAYSITVPEAPYQRKEDLLAGQSRTYTVKFDPQVSGTRTATLRFRNDAYNVTGEVPVEGSETYGNLDIPLTGTCYDPATADPTVYWLEVEDELGIEDTVTDESMAHENDEPVLTVLTWHYNRSYRTLSGEKAARWTLYDPAGNVATKANGDALENQLFTAVEDYVYDGKTCAKFSVPIPALGTGKAVRGTYTVKVKVYDSTGTYWTETTHFVPIETGWLFDDFTRADREATGSGALENGWTAMVSGGAVVGEAAIHADALELYGANGECPGVAGRIAVARDMSDVGYATDPHDFVGTGSWGFHFKTGAKTVGFGDGSTAGAFVLGSTASTWLTATPGQVGYAVAMRDNAVQLVKFEGSLLAGGTITQLGEAQFAGTQGKLLAVRVDFLPGQDEVDADAADDGVAHAAVPAKFRLYVKEVAKTGGSPIAECTAADKVLEYEFPAPEDHDLRYAGMMWNHGVAQVSDKTGAMFDDIYLPHMEGQTEPMMFHVIDEDVEGPEFYGFSIGGAYAAPDVARDGLTVTGMVHDASGVAGSVTWEVYNGETLLTSGTATPTAVSGSTTEYTVSCAIPSGRIDGSIRSADCHFRVHATDGDNDRSEGGTNVDSMPGMADYPFTLCDSTPAAPGWATAEADGAEMVVLRWARAAAGTQYIVVRSDEEIGPYAAPQGRTETMAEGTTVEGWGTVVYNGTGDNHLTGTWTAREFVVKEGSANYFAVYGMTGNETTGFYFSAPTKPNAYKWETTDEGTGETTVHTATNGSGVPVASSVTEGGWPCTTAKYEPGEGVDAFAYRTSVPEIGDSDPQNLALAFNFETRPATGSGWGGAWTGDTDKWKVHDGSLLSEGTHYPAPTGNKLYWHDTSHEESSSAEAKLTRQLKNPDSGEFYMAALINYFEPDTSTGAEGKWIQVALVDASGNDIVSFGMPGWDHNVAAIEYNGGQYCGAENIERDGYHLYSGHGNDYVVVGQLSREDHKFRMWAYYGGQYNTGEDQVTIPELYSKKDNGVEVPVGTERTALNTVQADFDFGENTTLPAVAGIQLRAGSVSGKELGHVYFDEVRFANTWEELFLFNAPEVYTFDFDKPEEGTGIMVGLDDEGHRMWEISDGALAHGNVGLNAQFGLYHRTGIKAASFTILDKDGNYILKSASDLAPESGGTRASVALDGTKGRTYSDWSTPEGGATGVAVPKSKISLDETYTVEVTLKSMGGKEAVVTAASESGGGAATDLFFGEFGEGRFHDKYVELYNGMNQSIDLSQYVIARGYAKDASAEDYRQINWYKWAFVSEEPYWMAPRSTIVLLTEMSETARLEKMTGRLEEKGCQYLSMTNDVLDSGGSAPIILLSKSVFQGTDEDGNNADSPKNKPWIDACGASDSIASERFIMSRKADAMPLPRSNLPVSTDDWEYRDWSKTTDDCDANYDDFITTAGQNQQKMGLGGNMEFKVFDDDIEPPTLVRGGVRVRKANGTLEEDYRAVSAGDRTYVVGGWSFTNMPAGVAVADLTLEQYQKIAEMWTGGLTQNGGLSWSSELGGNDLAGWANVIEAGNGKGQSHVEFDGITQRKYGAMIARASGSYAKDDEVWLGFDLDVAQLTDGMLTFGFAGGNAGFKNAYVAWSATGEEGSFTMPNEWNFDPNSGGASTWSEWSRSLDTESTGIPASAGHLWFRVYLSDYGSTVGTFRMDNMRVEGAPSVVRVTDAEISGRGMQFEVHVKDEASGLDAGTTGQQSGDDGKAYFDCGLGAMDEFRRVSLVNGGKDESTISWTAADSSGNEVTTGWGAKRAQEWYESTQAGHGKLRLSVPDADDDRAGDQTMLRSDFGMLMVEDDDEAPPVLDMESMKPRQEGTMAEWLLTEKTTLASESMESLEVGALGLNTTEGTTSRPRYSLRTAADTGLSEPTYAVYQSGWQAGSKYWTVKIRNTTGGAGTITKISFASEVGSVLAPTGYTVKYGVVDGGETGAEAGTTWSGSLLTSGTAWVKEGAAEGTTGSPIKTWANYPQTVSIPLAASGTTGDEIELRIYGTGTDPKGIGATWYLWDLKIEGTIAVPGVGGEDGYTYVTDNSLAQPGGANLPMKGSVYDEGSGLGAVPTYELTRGSKTVSSGAITFKAARDLSARTSKELGEFEQNIAVSGLGYGELALAEYKGTVHATDADHDREDASGNNMDQLDLDGQFAFTVVDQDLVGPTAPANVKVNGVAVPETAPNRLNVAWTNTPEFLVSFDVAHDIVPTETQLTSAETEHVEWREAHGVTNGMVKKASIQKKATGVGEYRVALLNDAASKSNAPAYSVAVTNGAIANYGFESLIDGEGGWLLSGSAGRKMKGESIGGGVTAPGAAEGEYCLYVPKGNVGSSTTLPGEPQVQKIVFTNTAGAVLKVSGSLKYYATGSTSKPRFRIDAYTDETMETRVGNALIVELPASPAATWLTYELGETTLGGAAANCIVLTLYSGTASSFFDDVRIGVDIGAGNQPSMRYVADTSSQGLARKYLFAVDADNDRAQDRMVGETAAFYTAYDVTPPTKVDIPNHGTSVTTDTVEDPTSQFDVTWSTSGVGPDDPEHPNHPTGSGTEVLSPWGSYRFYYRPWNPADPAVSAAGGAVNYINGLVDNRTDWTEWAYAEHGKAIEDPSEVAKGHTSYNDQDKLNVKGTTKARIYDLENDQDYIVVAVGVDAAGNVGKATAQSWATNNTIKFALTKGWRIQKDDSRVPDAWKSGEGAAWKNGATNEASALEWIAAGRKYNEATHEWEGEATKDYDLLYWDADRFDERTSNPWTLSGTVKSHWYVDVAPALPRNTLRFYRASYKDRWKAAVTNDGVVTAQTPLVSEDVYSMATVTLTEGANYVSLQGTPYTNTFAAVFGTDEAMWPVAGSADGATQVQFYSPRAHSFTEKYYLGKSAGNPTPRWYKAGTDPEEDVTDVIQTNGFFTRAFAIVLPEGDKYPERYRETTVTVGKYNPKVLNAMHWHPIMHVPTNSVVVLENGTRQAAFETTIESVKGTGELYNPVALNLPTMATPAMLGIATVDPNDPDAPAGFRRGKASGDRLYILDSETKEARGGSTIYCDANGTWRWVNGDGEVGYVIHPNDMMVIITHGGKTESWTWEYKPKDFYTLPDRHMGYGQ